MAVAESNSAAERQSPTVRTSICLSRSGRARSSFGRRGVDDVVRRYLGGLRSSMSYMDARTLEEYRENVSFVILR